MSARANPSGQKGVALLEALIAILVFSIGVVGLIGLLGIAVKSTSESKYRADAAYLVNQLFGRIWVDNHDDATVLATFQHRPGGATCAPTGADATHAAMVPNTTAGKWFYEIADRLPGAAMNRQQVIVDTTTNTVTITLCWREPTYVDSAGNPLYHRYTATAQIRG